MEGVGVGKSGRVESYSMVGYNAVLRPCRVLWTARYFFVSSGVVALAARALEADDDDFRQSFATCPALPQNIQRLLSKRRLRSSGVNFPSFPSLSEMSGLEPEEDFDCCGLGLDACPELALVSVLSDLGPDLSELCVDFSERDFSR
jgi:hypothetical protein